MGEKNFECPLCNSDLTESKYYEVVGVLEEKKKFESELKKQLSIAKKDVDKLAAEKKNLAAEKKKIQKRLLQEKKDLKKEFEVKFEKEKSTLMKNAQEEAKKLMRKDMIKAKKEGLDEGIKKQKRRYEQVNKLYLDAQKGLEKKEGEVKKLREEIKKGTTPQLEGIDLEHELVRELRERFPRDKIEHHGKGGDILHYITSEGKNIALIVYECKRTKTHNKSHVTQIKNDMIEHKADYGILVTSATSKNKSGFWTERDILIIHPWGAPHLAEILRRSLIQLYSLKLSDKELDERAKKLIEYIKSNKFRNSIRDNINRTKELKDILRREVDYFKSSWEQRNRHYNVIGNQSRNIEKASKTIIGEDLGKEAIPEQIITLEIKPKRKKTGILIYPSTRPINRRVEWREFRAEDLTKLNKKDIKEDIEEIKETEPKTKEEEDLLEKLKEKRFELAEERNFPAYFIFNNAVLEELASKRPTSKKEMIDIKGIGEKKIEEYGDIFLDVIKEDKK